MYRLGRVYALQRVITNLCGKGNSEEKAKAMKRALVFAIAATLAIVFCSPVMAETFSMKELIEGDLSIVSGDKLFDQFEYTATGDMPSAEGVNVSTFPDDLDGNYGIEFLGDFSDKPGNGASIAVIRYQVEVLDPNKRISGAHIYGDPSVTGNGLVKVTETFLPEVDNKLMTIYHISPDGGFQLVDSADFTNPTDLNTTLHVQKSIRADAQTAGGDAAIIRISQTFSQVLVPEPSTAVILITGLALLGCFVRHNRR